MGSQCAWMIDAPASMHASASAAISSGVIVTFGFLSFFVAPLMAASITTGTTIARPYDGSVRASRESLQATGLRVPVGRDLRRLPFRVRLRTGRCPPPEERAGGVVAGDGAAARRRR